MLDIDPTSDTQPYCVTSEESHESMVMLNFSKLFSCTAAQLKGAAPIPKEAINFQQKQRQLFQERRKNQADAIEFLHQFRADDDFVLRSARRSLGAPYDSHSAAPNVTVRYKRLEPGKTPDARAHTYSYAVYPNLSPTMKSPSPVKHDKIPNESAHSPRDAHVPDIIRDSLSFQHVFEALELAAKEASRIPLPEDGDLAGDTDQPGMQEDVTQSSPPVETIAEESDNENGNSILILQGEIDDEEDAISKRSECDAAGDSSATPFIPFEAFSRLGESLVLESRQAFAPPIHDASNVPSTKSDSSDDESIIPGLSFMQLGASMMANDLSSSLKEQDDKKPMVSPVKESEQSAMESSDLRTATDVTVSQDSTCLKSLTIETAPCEQTNDEQHPKEACCHVEETNEADQRITNPSENFNEDVVEDTVTPKRSNWNNVGFDNEGNVETKHISENDTLCDSDVDNCEDAGSDQVEKLDEWVIVTYDDVELVSDCDDGSIEKEELLEQEDVICRNAIDVDKEDTGCADEICELNEEEEEKVAENAAETPVKSDVDKEATNSTDEISEQDGEEEKVIENEAEILMNSDVPILPDSSIEKEDTNGIDEVGEQDGEEEKVVVENEAETLMDHEIDEEDTNDEDEIAEREEESVGEKVVQSSMGNEVDEEDTNGADEVREREEEEKVVETEAETTMDHEIDEEDGNGTDIIHEHEEEKAMENEAILPADSSITMDNDIDDANGRDDNQHSATNGVIRRRKKKSKKKGNYYVPSSGLFVSRQLLSR